eukprot:TRINITY_DN4284_c0_g1_i1.p1 TRINITY_DN4284_c0_g1~~TRINITY_DN4284_c0_g1_i1.p1  ORF type:complete len:144 (+),score=27.40 TRINITY_DN4284_c0_g1_i1:69-500(+)
MESSEIFLLSSDGDQFSLSRDAGFASVMVRNIATDMTKSVDGSGAAIPLPNVDSQTLEKVIDYLNYHVNHPVDEREDGDYTLDNISQWDLKFIHVEMSLLFKIVLAANFLDIKSLLDLGCKVIARMVIGKTPDEMEKTFKIPD